MNKKQQVLLFVGEDITAHLIMNKVVASVIAQGLYEPVLLFPENTHLKGSDILPLKEYAFYEKGLLNKVVYPFINDRPCVSAQYLSPQQLAEKYSLECRQIADVNDPAFVAELRKRDIACGMSIRCTQIFKPEVIDAIKHSGPFMNLHSGLLPEYRGVFPTLRRMFDIATGVADSSEYGCTLHKIDAGIDTGKIIEVKSLRLKEGLSAYSATVGLAEAGSDAICNVLDQLRKYTVRGHPQSDDKSAYYTFPTQKEIGEFKKAGIVLVRRQEVVSTLVDAFSKANSPHGVTLKEKLDSSIDDWYRVHKLKASRSIAEQGSSVVALPLGSSISSRPASALTQDEGWLPAARLAV